MKKVGLEGPEWRFRRPLSDRFAGNRKLSPGAFSVCIEPAVERLLLNPCSVVR